MAVVDRYAKIHVSVDSIQDEIDVPDRYGRIVWRGKMCGAISGSDGYGVVPLQPDLDLYIIILSDNSTYIAPAGGIVHSPDGTHSIIHGNQWPLRMAGNPTTFTQISSDQGNAVDMRTGVLCSDIDSDGSSTYVQYSLPSFPQPEVGQELDWDRYNQCKCNSTWESWPTVDGVASRRVYYVVFPAHNKGGDVNSVAYSPAKIVFDSPIFDPDYYPGKIYEGSWDNARSCNKPGGYFLRKSGSAWIERKNNQSDTSKSTVWLYNNGGYNTPAPKIGRQF